MNLHLNAARLTATVAAVLIAAATAACGGGDSADVGTAASDDPLLKLAQCLRDNGLDVDDPQPGSPVQISPGDGADPAAVARAQKACEQYAVSAGPQTFTPEQRVAAQDSLVRFSRCMRKRGVDLPAPEVGGQGQVQQQLPQGITPDDPRFQRAREQCEKHLDAAGLPGGGP